MKHGMHPEPAALTAEQMLRGQRWIIGASVISILFWTGISDRVISLFILGLNPSVTDTTLAFFFALGPLTAVLTALASPWVARRGKKRMLVPFYLVGAPFLVILAVLPSLRGICAPSTMVAGVALVLTGYYVFRSLGMAGWFPIINDNVPDEIRGRFFGRLRTSWQLVLVAYTAAVGWFLGPNPGPWQFQAVFVVSVVTNLWMTAVILRIPESPLAPGGAELTFWRTLAAPFRDRPYVCFLIFGVLFSLAAGMAGPFALRCLKGTLGAGDGFVVWMDTVASIGAAATLPLWGRLVDRFGGRTLFALLVPPLALLNLLWLFASPADPHWRILVALFYLFQGIFAFGIGVGITDMMLGSAREGNESAYINIAFVLNALAVGVGPFLGTLAARSFAGVQGQWGAVTLDANRWVFLCRFLLMLAPIWVISRLSREHGGHVGEAPQRLSAGLLNLLPSIRR
jgi:MFS family permease